MYNRTTICICGQEFHLLTKDSSEYVKEIASILNNKLNDYLKADHSLSNFAASIMSNMYFISEFNKVNNSDDNLRKQLKNYADENESLRKRLNVVENDLQVLLENDNNNYIDIAECDAIKDKIKIKEDEINAVNEKNELLKNTIVEKDGNIKNLSYKITELENKVLILEKQNNILRYGNK